jgi:Flp pilus assembly protein TadD
MHKSSDKPRNHPYILISLSLVVLTFAVYWQTLGHEFTNYDDGVYVFDNYYVKTGLTRESVGWAFTATYHSTWQPLVWLSYMVDYELYGLDPGGYHLTNLLLHTANTLLLLVVLMRMTGYLWRSAFVAAVFALHPLHVESVAWIAERKDVLSTLFWMLTMWAYVRYTERPDLNRYLPVMVAFTLGLMAKPMLVTLPFVLILLDWWPLGRFRQAGVQRALWKIVPEKIPLLVLAAASSVVTYLAQKKGAAVTSLEILSLWARISNALASYVNYIWKTIWPANLSVFYPHPMDTLPVWKVAAAGSLLVCISVVVILARRRHQYLLAGWLWFLGTILPVIGLVQFGRHAMADRFMYVPLIGLSLMVAWGIPEFLKRWRWRKEVLTVSAGVVLSTFVICTWFQVVHWRNSITLFQHALKVTPDNYLAHHKLGVALADIGRTEEGVYHNYRALEIRPNFSRAYSSLEFLLVELEFVPDARQFVAKTHHDLGSLFSKHGRLDEGIHHYYEALRVKPDYTEAYFSMGTVFIQTGKLDEAEIAFKEAIRLKPDHPESHLNLGVIYGRKGQYEKAIEEFSRVIELNPQHSEAHYNLGLAYQRKGMFKEAEGYYKKALEIKPDYIKAREKLESIQKGEG